MEYAWGGVEGGGTKFRCLLGRGATDSEILDEAIIPTTTPAETLSAVVAFFTRHHDKTVIAGLGVACFGPIDLDPTSPQFGTITTTPKPGWSNTDVVGFLRANLYLPVAWETDVNGALIGEHQWGAAQGLHSAVYYTVGTGIGGGALIDGQPVHGLLHPEMGHIPVAAWTYEQIQSNHGFCPYHGNGCLEGIAAGPALERRAGRPPAMIPVDDPIWDDEARYLAYAAVVTTLMLSPQRIIFGGSVMLNQDHLFPRVRAQFLSLMNGYVRHPTVTEDIDSYIVAPQLGNRAGALGALALAMNASNASH